MVGNAGVLYRMFRLKSRVLSTGFLQLPKRKNNYHTKNCFGHRGKQYENGWDRCPRLFEKEGVDARLVRLVEAYREHGHRKAKLDPFFRTSSSNLSEYVLNPQRFGLGDRREELELRDIFPGLLQPRASLADVVDYLEGMYCGTMAIQAAHICDLVERVWLMEQYEVKRQSVVNDDTKQRLAKQLLQSQVFDNFLAKRFGSVKRYGAEGAESMMAFFDQVLTDCGAMEIEEVIIGMPHRGRLNLLTDLLKYPKELFFYKLQGNKEFVDSSPSTGDVISHLASSIDLSNNSGGSIHVTMLPNPSHLEAVNPVCVGKARARQLTKRDYPYIDSPSPTSSKVLCLQVHGDASFSAQGIVAETLCLSSLPHFDVGGSVHLVVNNQLGFTTEREQGRSSSYCSDIMQSIGAPIIHVNGADPEEVLRATSIAMAYRQKFQKDILIDLVCFRRWGHNELDNPSLTQPLMYKTIEKERSVPDTYAAKLQHEGVLSQQMVSDVTTDHWTSLDKSLEASKKYQPQKTHLLGNWKGFQDAGQMLTSWDTGCSVDLLKFAGAASVTVPASIVINERLRKSHIDDRMKKLETGRGIDWATAEALAMGTLLLQGFNVRLSGQDVGRGTFSHRHAMFVCQESDAAYVPLNFITPEQRNFFEVVNSPLSEEAVLGYEYGFSTESPQHLVLWEAQFGDFFNGAQPILDTFVSSGEAKWLLQSGLVLLLPHGYDGAGPDHSSCQVERFLLQTDSSELGPDGDSVNMHITHPTTPAQYYHLLRRQMVRNFRKPLIVQSPKTLLRLPAATSNLDEMTIGTTFQPVLSDPSVNHKEVKRVVLCSGKHYYALDKYRREKAITNTAIVRLELLCPFPSGAIYQELSKFVNATEYIWSQEEPMNKGPWTFFQPRFANQLGYKLKLVSRPPYAASAVGVAKIYQRESTELLTKSFQTD